MNDTGSLHGQIPWRDGGTAPAALPRLPVAPAATADRPRSQGARHIAALERLLRFATLSPDAAFTPDPVAVADGLWTIERRSWFLGLPDPCTSSVLRLDSGDVVVIGAPSFPSSCRRALRELDRTAAVIAPNSFHHCYAREMLSELGWPRFATAPGLPARVPTLPAAVVLREGAAPPWLAGIEYAVFGPVRGVSEVIFFHVASRTLILTDLASNVVEVARPVHRLMTQAYGIPAGFGSPRNARLVLRADRAEARRALGKALEWPFERILVGHGARVEEDARERFRAAFAEFLAPRPIVK